MAPAVEQGRRVELPRGTVEPALRGQGRSTRESFFSRLIEFALISCSRFPHVSDAVNG